MNDLKLFAKCYVEAHDLSIDDKKKLFEFIDNVSNVEIINLLETGRMEHLSEPRKQQIIESLLFVNTTMSFNEETPLNLILKIKPDILVKGGDWCIDSIVGSKYVTSYGGKVKTIPLIKGMSTSNILKRILND